MLASSNPSRPLPMSAVLRERALPSLSESAVLQPNPPLRSANPSELSFVVAVLQGDRPARLLQSRA
jgi:hypothetical protein